MLLTFRIRLHCGIYEGLIEFRTPILYGKSEVICRESGIAILFIGHMSELGESVWKAMKEAGYRCSLINARFAKPLDTEMIRDLCRDHQLIVTIEENVLAGGFGEQVVQYVMQSGEKTRVRTIGISDDYVEHGNVEVLRKEVGLDQETIVAQIKEDYLMIKED